MVAATPLRLFSLEVAISMIFRLVLMALALAGGCTPDAEITSYKAPKPPPPVRPQVLAGRGERPAVDRESLPFTYDLPEGWSEKPAGMMRLAEFEVRDGERQAVVSVSSAGGDLVDNINRWRGQLKLADAPGEAIRQSIRELMVDSRPASYVELFGPEAAEGRQAILGVVVPSEDRQWFIKLQGDAEVAAREKQRFEQFAESLRFKRMQGEN